MGLPKVNVLHYRVLALAIDQLGSKSVSIETAQAQLHIGIRGA